MLTTNTFAFKMNVPRWPCTCGRSQNDLNQAAAVASSKILVKSSVGDNVKSTRSALRGLVAKADGSKGNAAQVEGIQYTASATACRLAILRIAAFDGGAAVGARTILEDSKYDSPGGDREQKERSRVKDPLHFPADLLRSLKS